LGLVPYSRELIIINKKQRNVF